MTESKYIYVRDNVTGVPSLKTGSVLNFKADTESFKKTRFWDDIVSMHKDLSDTMQVLAHLSNDLRISYQLSSAVKAAIPTLDYDYLESKPAMLEEECEKLVVIAKRFLRNELSMPPGIKAAYLPTQLAWKPNLKPGNPGIDEDWFPFMGVKDVLQHKYLLGDSDADKMSKEEVEARYGQPSPSSMTGDLAADEEDIDIVPVDGE